METNAVFSKRGVCRLETTYANGSKEIVPFESLSEMLAYCEEHFIEVTVGDCRIEP